MLYCMFGVLWSCCMGFLSLSATVTIHNETDHTLYTGVYYYLPQGTAELKTPSVSIESGKEVALQEPTISLLNNRFLIFDDQELPGILTYEQFKTLGTVRVRLPGHYYIAMKDGRLKGYTLTEWHVVRPFVRTHTEAAKAVFTQPLSLKIKTEQPAVQNNPYKTTGVTVRTGMQLHPDERAYRAKRQQVVRRGLEKFLGLDLNGKYIPEIAVVTSGGGHRAMLYSAGSLAEAQNAGLLDTIMYISSLSGSTWSLSYIVHEYMRGNYSIDQMVQNLVQKSTKSLADLTSQEVDLLSDVLLWKKAFAQPMALVDLYGLLLGNLLFSEYGDLRHRTYLSQEAGLIADGSFPFPIYTAVPAETTEFEKLMYEFTPYEVWAPWGISIPPYAFGNRFINGVRTKSGELFAPEQPMGTLLGVFGSAYAVTLQRVYQEVEQKMAAQVRAIVGDIFFHKEVGQARIASADFHNFMMGMSSSAIKNKKLMLMADAGLGITGGLPFQPVSGKDGRRKADIYIIIDISEDVNQASDLKKIADYMAVHKLKFPQIKNYKELGHAMVSVFSDPNDAAVPTVIYMPRIKEQAVWDKYKSDPAYAQYNGLEKFSMDSCIKKMQAKGCTALNLQYDVETARGVSQQGAFNMQASMDTIKRAINDCIDRKLAKT
jgi:hypothetical protein